MALPDVVFRYFSVLIGVHPLQLNPLLTESDAQLGMHHDRATQLGGGVHFAGALGRGASVSASTSEARPCSLKREHGFTRTAVTANGCRRCSPPANPTARQGQRKFAIWSENGRDSSGAE